MAAAIPGSLDPHQRECAQLMHANCSSRRLHEVFSDFCEFSALAISNAVDRQHFEKREARYLEMIKMYTPEEMQRFAQMLACITFSLEACIADCLGQLFMSLELGDHWKGQYFTPYTVSLFMAKMTVCELDSAQVEARGGFITMAEPAVGAGGMVIAAAQALKDQQINYQRCLHVTAQDIEKTAVHMAYIQLSLLHVPAVVIHGNTISGQCWEHWLTPAHVLGLWDWRLQTKECIPTDPETPASSPADPEIPPVAITMETALHGARNAIVEERVRCAEQMKLF